MEKRKLYHDIWNELAHGKAMVFLAGPRQAGKTTFSRLIASEFKNTLYFNWDLDTDRKMLLSNPLFFEALERKDSSPPLVILDEIHKYRRWKNYLKGIYDRFSIQYKFLVLGSGRLNVYQKGGDSLAGRYFLFNLWPLTLAELREKRRPFDFFLKDPLCIPAEDNHDQKIWDRLSLLSGFPEPYLSQSESTYRRWSRTYRQQLIREDIRNMTEMKRIDEIEHLYSLLPSKVGSPLSMDSLARDIQVSFNSIRNWLEVFDSFFLTFRLSPWTKKVSRAITKGQKLYFYDYVSVSDPGVRFENMVALELLRAVSNWTDLGLGDFSLHYIRNKEQQEVDFLIVNNRVPFLLVETKLSDDVLSKDLVKFQNILKIPAVQLVNKTGVSRLVSNEKQKILIISASRWLSSLP
ncbi:MAG: ATP-binding protein [Elusimicrobiota bacterium]